MGVSEAAPVVTPGVEMSTSHEEAHKFRRIIARANFLAQYKIDIRYSVKEAARGVAKPRQSHWDKFLKLAKYLKGHMRYVTKYAKQSGAYSINMYGDSDFAGNIETRKSTSGGIMCWEDHPIKT